jgi:hypothetical protein
MDLVAHLVTIAQGITPLIHFVAAAIDTLDDRCRPGTWSSGAAPVILFGDQVTACKIFDSPVFVAPDIIVPEVNPAGHFCFRQHTKDTILVNPVFLDDDVAALSGIFHEVDTCMVIIGNTFLGFFRVLFIIVFDIECLVAASAAWPGINPIPRLGYSARLA